MFKVDLKSTILLFFWLVSSLTFAADKTYQEKLKQRLTYNAQHFLDGFTLAQGKKVSIKHIPLPQYSSEEVAVYLSKTMNQFNTKLNPLIIEYIDFWSSQPMGNIRAWMAVNHTYSNEINSALAGFVFPESIAILPYSLVSLLPQKPKESDCVGAWQIKTPIALAMGGKINARIDQRRSVAINTRMTAKYLQKLYQKYRDWTLVVTAFVCGASSLNKAIIQSNGSKDFWQIYPFLPHATRDFYPAMLAASFVLNKTNWNVVPYQLEPIAQINYFEITDTLNKQQIIDILNIDADWFNFANAQKTSPIYYPNTPVAIPSKIKLNDKNKIAIYKWKRKKFFPPRQEDSCYVFYRTNRKDFFKDLTRWFGYSLSAIKKTNGFTSNVLKNNYDVFFRFPTKDSLHYAQFSSMTSAEKDKASGHEDYNNYVQTPKISTPKGAKIVYYTIKQGDTLWDIAMKYNTSDKKIQAWNHIDENIRPGQKIKIYLEK